ncbi:MAG: response regulator transcription factor [Permianibacter sp.]
MMTAFRLLLIDDDVAFTSTLARALQRQQWQVATAADGASALQQANTADWDAVLLDLRLGSDNGLVLLQSLRQRLPRARIVMLTGFGSIATAVEAIKRGADDYLVKPAPLSDLIAALQGQSKAITETETETLAEQPLNLRQLSWEHIQRVLTEHDGNISAAARALGMHRRTLQRKLSKVPRPR